jgi:glycerol-3-phosphate acyltransferase PlsY
MSDDTKEFYSLAKDLDLISENSLHSKKELPLYYAFKGGKGVSTSCGVMCFCFPVPALICYALTIDLIAWKRYISLGSMFLLTLYAVLVSVTYQGEWRVFVILWSCLLAVICIARHHANISRLIKGTENKLGGKKKQ